MALTHQQEADRLATKAEHTADAAIDVLGTGQAQAYATLALVAQLKAIGGKK